ncbi:glutamate 5-kinase [Desulfoplanes formicivorans]|uniref:Glutamate 5-kinase n=1 Tax=Desulfoplanes formicivorans TaxID=1592317 RepID=A0A194AG30_9BACT|nr:glutamate 5-kinase [Desulfoplanes formicivorans]GAU07734.1 gamma-glutamyl kinase [Desulfoplanes formicivorans]
MSRSAVMSDCQKARRDVLTHAKRVVIKVGSAVLTGSNGLDLRVVNRLADQMAGLHDKGIDLVLVSSGAVAAGCRVMGSCHARQDLAYKQATSAIGQSRLMHFYDEAFARYDTVTAQVLLTRADLQDRERFLNARNTLSMLLGWRVIPIVNENDTVAVHELKFGDNDALAALILNAVEADLFINLTSADGVFTDNPLENPDACFLPYIEDIASMPLANICRGKTGSGTGGMYSKLLAARRAAQLGVPTLILSGKTRFGLEKVFAGEELGTWIMPEARSISRRKFWMAYNLDPGGTIVIDQGAVCALTDHGKSLLPAGIADVQGDFGMGDMVRIEDVSGRSIGVGVTNYTAEELRRIKGRNTSEIETILGHASYPETIHRDNMLLDAAI